MNKKLIYFLRTHESFQEFITNYNLKQNNCKNEPLFTYRLNQLNLDLLHSADILLITSRLAFKALLNTKQFYNKQLIVVGKTLTEYAQNNNISNIIAVGNNVAEIIEHLNKNKIKYQPKKILYLRGNYIKKDIKNILSDFMINEELAYEIEYKDSFTQNFLNDLKSNNIQMIVFFSLKSVEKFLMICDQFELTQSLGWIDSISMSLESLEILKKYFKSSQIFFSIKDSFR